MYAMSALFCWIYRMGYNRGLFIMWRRIWRREEEIAKGKVSSLASKVESRNYIVSRSSHEPPIIRRTINLFFA